MSASSLSKLQYGAQHSGKHWSIVVLQLARAKKYAHLHRSSGGLVGSSNDTNVLVVSVVFVELVDDVVFDEDVVEFVDVVVSVEVVDDVFGLDVFLTSVPAIQPVPPRTACASSSSRCRG